jgi:Sulfatase
VWCYGKAVDDEDWLLLRRNFNGKAGRSDVARPCELCATVCIAANVVVLLADDLGYADVGIHGATEVSTPNMDSLAKNGVRCTNGYVSGPYCSPTRAGLLTGRYQ